MKLIADERVPKVQSAKRENDRRAGCNEKRGKRAHTRTVKGLTLALSGGRPFERRVRVRRVSHFILGRLPVQMET